ncbi:MAG: dephospho-CoA kinase [Bacillota bacterium]|jgi:dephospho-CoA kinase|nr:dephospho-CoA kinase [Bacillota bacterium]NLV62645.1 dephospho-CoA kinase [Clostridiaceae bacterium]
MIIGITGGIGSGKSTVSRILSEHGAEIILADKIAREVVMPGMKAYNQIVRTFGRDILDEDGSINRKKLGDIVFSDPELLKKLNGFTHGAVAERISQKLDALRNEGTDFIVIEAVVPIQHGFLDLVDTVWVVIADEQIRKRRIIARNNYSEQEAMQRIKAQMSDRMYISIADKIIYNNGSIEDLRALVWEVLRNEKEDSQ